MPVSSWVHWLTLTSVTPRSRLLTAGAVTTAKPSGQMSPLVMRLLRLKLTTSLASPLIPALLTQHSRTAQMALSAKTQPKLSQKRRQSHTMNT